MHVPRSEAQIHAPSYCSTAPFCVQARQSFSGKRGECVAFSACYAVCMYNRLCLCLNLQIARNTVFDQIWTTLFIFLGCSVTWKPWKHGMKLWKNEVKNGENRQQASNISNTAQIVWIIIFYIIYSFYINVVLFKYFVTEFQWSKIPWQNCWVTRTKSN